MLSVLLKPRTPVFSCLRDGAVRTPASPRRPTGWPPDFMLLYSSSPFSLATEGPVSLDMSSAESMTNVGSPGEGSSRGDVFPEVLSTSDDFDFFPSSCLTFFFF